MPSFPIFTLNILAAAQESQYRRKSRFGRELRNRADVNTYISVLIGLILCVLVRQFTLGVAVITFLVAVGVQGAIVHCIIVAFLDLEGTGWLDSRLVPPSRCLVPKLSLRPVPVSRCRLVPYSTRSLILSSFGANGMRPISLSRLLINLFAARQEPQ